MRALLSTSTLAFHQASRNRRWYMGASLFLLVGLCLFSPAGVATVSGVPAHPLPTISIDFCNYDEDIETYMVAGTVSNCSEGIESLDVTFKGYFSGESAVTNVNGEFVLFVSKRAAPAGSTFSVEVTCNGGVTGMSAPWEI